MLPTLCHFGEAFSAFVRRPAEVIRQLKAIADAGYHGIRFWDILGYYDQNRPGDSKAWKAWAGKEVTPVEFIAFSGRVIPPTPDYYVQLEKFLHALRALGLTAHHSRGDCNSIPFSAILAHCMKVSEVQQKVGLEVICLNEALNEAWQNGVPEPERLDQMLTMFSPRTLRATSAGTSEHPDDMMPMLTAHADVWAVHGDRGAYKLEHIFALGYNGPGRLSPKPGWQGEPTGPGQGVSVGREDSPEMLGLMAASALMTRQAWVYMSGFGVFWDGAIESQPGFYEVAQVKDMLPRDVMTFGLRVHGGATWRDKRIFGVTEDHSRCDQVIHPDGRFVAVASSMKPGRHSWTVDKSCECLVINPANGEAASKKLAKGDTLVLDFERGRLIVGHLT